MPYYYTMITEESNCQDDTKISIGPKTDAYNCAKAVADSPSCGGGLGYYIWGHSGTSLNSCQCCSTWAGAPSGTGSEYYLYKLEA